MTISSGSLLPPVVASSSTTPPFSVQALWEWMDWIDTNLVLLVMEWLRDDLLTSTSISDGSFLTIRPEIVLLVDMRSTLLPSPFWIIQVVMVTMVQVTTLVQSPIHPLHSSKPPGSWHTTNQPLSLKTSPPRSLKDENWRQGLNPLSALSTSLRRFFLTLFFMSSMSST